MGGQQKANPYWWRSILEFNRLHEVMAALIKNKSIKKDRLLQFAEYYADDYLSPIVRLTGMTLLRMAKKMGT